MIITCRLQSLIAQVKERKGILISYQELENACGLSRQSISKLAENKEVRVTLKQLGRLLEKLNAYGFNFTIQDLIEYEERRESEGQGMALAA